MCIRDRLYGINSRERDKAGFIADKNRYAPWDGGSMSGRLECHADGADLTITRAPPRQTAPMADFQAVYTGTASPVEGLTGANCGETLLDVSREVFERSADVYKRQGLHIGLQRLRTFQSVCELLLKLNGGVQLLLDLRELRLQGRELAALIETATVQLLFQSVIGLCISCLLYTSRKS